MCPRVVLVFQVPYECVEPLINFPERVVLNKLKGPYRKGIIAIMKVCCCFFVAAAVVVSVVNM